MKRNRRRRKNGKKNNNNNNNNNGGSGIPLASGRSGRAKGGVSTIFPKTEYLGQVTSSTTFTIRHVFQINPGLASTFPWLNGIAKMWQYYRFRKFSIKYETVSNATISGQVIICTDYNNTDAAPISLESALNNYGAVNTASYRNVTETLDVNKMFPFGSGSKKFVRNANVTGDINLYDACKVYVITDGFTGNFIVGNLWAEYEIELNTPQTSLVNELQFTKVSYSYLKSDYALNQGVTGKIPFADYFLSSMGMDVNGLGLPNPIAGIFVLPAGMYLISVGVVFENTVSEFSNASCWISYDGVSVGIDVASTASRDEIVPYNYNPMNLTVPVKSDGTNTVALFVIYTETAGNTGEFLSQKCWISFTSV